MSNRPSAIHRHRARKSRTAHRQQRLHAFQRRTRRDMRLDERIRENRRRRVRGLGPLCEDCEQRPCTMTLQGHGALYVLVCEPCAYGNEDGDSWADHGWAPRCPACGGSGCYDDAVPCMACDGQGTVDW